VRGEIKNIMRIKKQAPVCPACDSKNVLVSRKKQNIFWCRRCNFSGPKRVFFRKRKRQFEKIAKVFLEKKKIALKV